MKKLKTVILSAALALAAGHAGAQAVAHAVAQGAMQGAVQAASQALATAVTAAPGPSTASSDTRPARPQARVVKDFAAARAFELERSKFHQGAIEKFRKCVEGAKATPDLTACQTAYHTALTANMNLLVKQGKLAAAYGTAAPSAPAKPAVALGK